MLFKLSGIYNISLDDLMQLTMEINRNIYYDVPAPTQSSEDLAGFLNYFNNTNNQKKYQSLTILRKNYSIILKKYLKQIKKKSLNLRKSKHTEKNSQSHGLTVALAVFVFTHTLFTPAVSN